MTMLQTYVKDKREREKELYKRGKCAFPVQAISTPLAKYPI